MAEQIETLDKLFSDDKITSDIARSIIAEFKTHKNIKSVTLQHTDDRNKTTAEITSRVLQVLKYSYHERAKDVQGYWMITCRAALLITFADDIKNPAIVDVPVQVNFKVRSAGVTAENRGDKAFSVESAAFTQAPQIMSPLLDHSNKKLTDDDRSQANGEVYLARQAFEKYQADLLEVAKDPETWSAELTPLSN